MGSGASTLTKEQSVKLTQTLKEKYESYKAAGEAESDIQQKLTKEYHEIVAELKIGDLAVNANADAPKLAKIGKASTSSSTGKLPSRASFEDKEKVVTPKSGTSSKMGLGSSKMASGSTKGGGTRRRSFDGNKAGGATAAAVAAAQEALKIAEESAAASAAAAAETPAPAPEDAQADSWDSVSQQPYCNVCQMAFKSATFLERHVKYSDLHIKNVQKQKEANDPVLPDIGTVDEMFPVSQSGKLEAKQVEGKHYRLLYSGSKLFWRTQDNVDLNIYHHILPSTIEVVSYDTAKGREMNRIYLDYAAVCDLSGVTALAMASAGARAAASRAQAARELEATAAVGTTAKAEKEAATAAADAAALAAAAPSNVEDELSILARYIIQRLQMGSALAGGMKKMEFAKLSSDTYTKSPVMDKIPVILVPISVARRRRTNAEEIEQTITGLAQDRAALAEATSHAHKVASVVYSASSSLSAKKWWADFNPVRRKWIWAIRRVIRQKLVAETTAVLANLELNKKRELKRQYTSGLSPKGNGVNPLSFKAKEV
jgi:hypothetical protein